MSVNHFFAWRRTVLFTGLLLVPVAAAWSVQAFADDATVEATCCAKRAYCCTVKARCCANGKMVESEIIPLLFLSDESAQPTCCDKRFKH